MNGAILPLPQYVFMVWCLIKQETLPRVVELSCAQGQLYLYLNNNQNKVYT
jgi:hypothetical protein